MVGMALSSGVLRRRGSRRTAPACSRLADGRPQVSLEQAGAVRLDPRLRSTPLESAIPTIPYAAIAAFLSRPTVMTDDEIRHAPYVLAFRDMHEVAGSGNEVYVRNLS